jgi:prepilin-type processing-associated H-X9-DG protein
MPVTLLGIGTALPSHRLSQAESAAMAQRLSATNDVQTTMLRRLQRRSGVAFRHSVLLADADGPLPDRLPFYTDANPTTAERMARFAAEAGPLALRASSAALAAAAVDPAAITHLVTVCCTGFQAPGFDLELIQALPLAADVARTQVGFMGCHGALNGLRVAHAFAQADAGARVLLCALELCSLHQQLGWHPERVVANALFADGAAATVLAADGTPAAGAGAGAESGAEAGAGAGPEQGQLQVSPPWRLLASGSTVLPDSADAMAWTIGDHGFEMGLSPRVPALIAARLAPWLDGWLAAQGLDRAAIGSWALHPGGPRLLESVRECLDLPASAIEPSTAVLRECGNMSSATILFILDRLQRAGAPLPCVALAFGPGLCVEAALLG